MQNFSVDFYKKEDGNCPIVAFLDSLDGTDISRALYFFVIGHKIIITNGFLKKTKKTPLYEIDLARKYRADYLKREREKNE